MKTLITLLLFISVLPINVIAQKDSTANGAIKGTVIDSTTKKPIEFVIVVAQINGVTKGSAITDEDGSYEILQLDSGVYRLIFQTASHQKITLTDIEVNRAQKTIVDAALGARSLPEIIIKHRKPIIEKTRSSQTVDGNLIRKSATRNVNKMAATNRGVVSINGQTPSFSGSRADGTRYFVDGVAVIGSVTINGEPGFEEYKHLNESGFKNPLEHPLSTFSLDVDAASYTNIKRFIDGGMFPPPASVRLEEMINYFPYDYRSTNSDSTFSVHYEVSDCPWNKKAKLMKIGIKGKDIKDKELPASNLVFLIDVSGSMDEPNKLPLVKRSLELLVKKLKDNDRVAIVVYAGNSGLVLPSTKGSDKDKIINAIRNLGAGGSTAGGAGIELAYKIAKENFLKEGNNRVILATDGDFNVGVSDEHGLTALIETKRKDKIFLTVCGYGIGNLKDSKLELLADKGNGNYFYINEFAEAQKVFELELYSTLYTIAKDVKLQLEFNPGIVHEYRLIGYENRELANEHFNNDTIDAGEVGAGKTVTALYEITLKSDKNEIRTETDSLKYQIRKIVNVSNELLTVKIRYKHPDQDVSRKIWYGIPNHSVPFKEASTDFKFAAAVAQFGMILRDSKFKGSADYESTIKLAKFSKGEDIEGYRADFVRMVKLAAEMASR